MTFETKSNMSSDLVRLFNGESPSHLAPANIPKLDLGHEDFRPVTKRNVGYIVSGLAFDDDENVLMMQEAKKSCRGRWYLPAGRLEPNETLVEGVKREVLEETGLRYEPETILCVEMNGVAWQRVTFIGRTTSGRLKPKPDEESLDAKWMKYPDLKSQPIRSGDIFSLIELGLEYLKMKQGGAREAGFSAVMPIEKRLDRVFLRLAITTTFLEDDAQSLCVLVEASSNQLPVIGMGGTSINVKKILTVAVKHLTRGGLKELICQGLLAIEHDGRSSKDDADIARDGLCHTFHLKVTVDSCASVAEGFKWEKLDEQSKAMMKTRKLSPAVLFL